MNVTMNRYACTILQNMINVPDFIGGLVYVMLSYTNSGIVGTVRNSTCQHRITSIAKCIS